MLSTNYPTVYPYNNKIFRSSLSLHRRAKIPAFGAKVIYRDLYLKDKAGNSVPAEFLELTHPRDLVHIENLPQDWNNAQYKENIVNKMKNIYKPIYAIATYGEEDLPERIQCLCDFSYLNQNELQLIFLQTKPKNMWEPNKQRDIQNAGKAMMYSVMKYALYHGFDSITLLSGNDPSDFYKKTIGMENLGGEKFKADRTLMRKIMRNLRQTEGITNQNIL